MTFLASNGFLIIVVACVALWLLRTPIKNLVAKITGKKAADGTTEAGDTSDGNKLSKLITELSNLPLVKRLDISREAIVRSFLGMMIIKLGDYIKASDLTDGKKKEGLDALNIIAPLIMVQEDVEKPAPPAPPAPPVPPPAPIPVKDPVL